MIKYWSHFDPLAHDFSERGYERQDDSVIHVQQFHCCQEGHRWEPKRDAPGRLLCANRGWDQPLVEGRPAGVIQSHNRDHHQQRGLLCWEDQRSWDPHWELPGKQRQQQPKVPADYMESWPWFPQKCLFVFFLLFITLNCRVCQRWQHQCGITETGKLNHDQVCLNIYKL